MNLFYQYVLPCICTMLFVVLYLKFGVEKFVYPRGIGKAETGLGVFATRDLIAGELVDECLHVHYVGWQSHALDDYTFMDGTALGYCSMYNHRDDPNIKKVMDHYDYNYAKLIFRAARNISKGEELSINYGRDWWLNRPIIQQDHEVHFHPDPDSLTKTYYEYKTSEVEPLLQGIYATKFFTAGEKVETCGAIQSYFPNNVSHNSSVIAIKTEPIDHCTGLSASECPDTCFLDGDVCKPCKDEEFKDAMGFNCYGWRNYKCEEEVFDKYNYTTEQKEAVLKNCPSSCSSCKRHPDSALHHIVFGNCAIYQTSKGKDDANIRIVKEDIGGTIVYGVYTTRSVEEGEEFRIIKRPFMTSLLTTTLGPSYASNFRALSNQAAGLIPERMDRTNTEDDKEDTPAEQAETENAPSEESEEETEEQPVTEEERTDEKPEEACDA